MSFSDYTILKIEDVCEVIDSLHKSPKYVDEGYPMIRVKDLSKGYLKFDSPAYVTKDVYEEFNKKHKPQKGDIIFSRVGSYGIVSLVNCDTDFCLGQNTVILTHFKKDKVDNIFLYYLLTSNIVFEQIEKFVTGSTQKTISMKSIKSIECPLPIVKKQKAIADILSSLDDKIELNHQMNKTLEEMAQALFKRWFVDFEFPNEEGKPYKSSGGEMVESELGMIPDKWEIITIKDVAALSMGVSPSSDSYNNSEEGLPLINGAADFKGKNISPGKYTSSPKKICELGDMIFGVRATIGNTVFADKQYAIGRGVAALRPKKNMDKEVIFYQLEYAMEKLLNSASGSVFSNLKKGDIESVKFAYYQPIVQQFHNIVNPIVEKIIFNDKETLNLTLIRDSVLPKLMSGEIRVSDLKS